VNTFMDLQVHAKMLADHHRMQAYRDALYEVVQKNDVVVDLGTGTGVLAAFACQAGAARVYAVERLPIVEVARATVAAGGFADRVVFYEQDFATVDLPQRVDVLVSETLGSFGVGETSFGTLVDCREHMLRQSGRMIPNRVRLFAAPVSAPEFYDLLSFTAPQRFGLDLAAVKELALNQPQGTRITAAQCLSPAIPLCTINLATSDRPTADRLDIQVDFPLEQEGTMHGIAGWFEADLSPSVILSNAPTSRPSSWQHRFFPLLQPVVLTGGERLALRLRMDCLETDHFIWRWDSRVIRVERGVSVTVAHFQQDSFRGQVMSRNLLRTSAPTYAPRLTPDGEVARFLLEHVDGTQTEEDLIALWNRQHPPTTPDQRSRLQHSIRRALVLGDIA
jgi:PRMT5 oligomerisation domain/Ribosomal protein L11 methyltransferase (PrmA)